MLIDHSLKELQKPGLEGNREAALRCLAGEVEMVDFTLGERKELLELCMTEECEQEGEQLLEELFYSWFSQCGEEPLALLQQLDVADSRQELDSTGVRMSAPAKVLRLMIRADPARVEQFSRLLDDTKVIPQEELTPEKALYWKMMALIFAREEDGVHLRDILPHLPLFLKYFSSYILKKKDDQMGNWKFITIELLTILGVYVYSGIMMNYNCKKLKRLLENKLVPGFLTPTIKAFIGKLEELQEEEKYMKDAENMVNKAFSVPGPMHIKMEELREKVAKKEANDEAKKKAAVEREIALQEMSDERIDEILELIDSKPVGKSKKKKKANKANQNIAKIPIENGNNNSNYTQEKKFADENEGLKKSIENKLVLIQKQRKHTEEIANIKGKEIATLKSCFEEVEISETNVLSKIAEIDEKRKQLMKKSNENYEKMDEINKKRKRLEECISKTVKDSDGVIAKLEVEVETLQAKLNSLSDPSPVPQRQNQQYLDSINLKISAKEEELECPVCLETSSAPIYMCLEQHLICSSCRPRITTCPECREPYTDGRPGAGVGAGAGFRRHRYAERAGVELEALRRERRQILGD